MRTCGAHVRLGNRQNKLSSQRARAALGRRGPRWLSPDFVAKARRRERFAIQSSDSAQTLNLRHTDETIHRTDLTVHPAKRNLRLNSLTNAGQSHPCRTAVGIPHSTSGGWGAPSLTEFRAAAPLR